MKKRCLTALLLTLVLLLAVGCANDTPPADQTGGEGSVQTPAPTGEEETPGGQPDPEQPDPEGSSEAEGERPEPADPAPHLEYRTSAGDSALMHADFGSPDATSTE